MFFSLSATRPQSLPDHFHQFFLLRIWNKLSRLLLTAILGMSILLLGAAPAWAGLNDDHYDGNIFALYAGNGSLFPPRVNLKEALQRDKPILLVFYVDDSSDCKLYASVVSQLDAFYGRAANLIPINADTLPLQASADLADPSHYYQGFVPQTILLDQNKKVVLNEKGNLAFEQIDDLFREVFDLLPRSESVELKRRPINEFNAELAE